MATTLHRYLPELVRYINLNQLCPYLVSERLITRSLSANSCCNHTTETSRQYCIVSLVDAMETTGPACYRRFRRALERSMNEESDVPRPRSPSTWWKRCSLSRTIRRTYCSPQLTLVLHVIATAVDSLLVIIIAADLEIVKDADKPYSLNLVMPDVFYVLFFLQKCLLIHEP